MLENAYNDYFNNTLRMYDDISNKNIITIDQKSAKCLDSAFSIEKDESNYIVDVYISDIVTFLNYNRELAQTAYEVGKNYYIKTPSGTNRISMLPSILINDFFSLNSNNPKNVINFTFYIDNNGNILEHNIKLSRIKVNTSLSKKSVSSIMNGIGTNPLYNDLCHFDELTGLLYEKHKLANNSNDNLGRMQAIPSTLVNHLIAEDANLAIYSHKNYYTKTKTNRAHSSTPLRKIVSDINLGLYLYQNKLSNINDRDIYMIEDNLAEIITHLNQVEKLDENIKKFTKNLV